MPDGSASKTTYVDMYKKLGMLANKGAQTNDPKVAPLLFKIMSSMVNYKTFTKALTLFCLSVFLSLFLSAFNGK